jgi:hypothetical protein
VRLDCAFGHWLHNWQLKSTRRSHTLKGSHEIRDGRILLKHPRDTSFNKDLSNEPNFGRIYLAGQYLQTGLSAKPYVPPSVLFCFEFSPSFILVNLSFLVKTLIFRTGPPAHFVGVNYLLWKNYPILPVTDYRLPVIDLSFLGRVTLKQN